MKTPDTITAKVREFREKFVRDDGLMDKYHGDETTADAIETFLEQALLDVRRETIEEVHGLLHNGENEKAYRLTCKMLLNPA